MSIVVAFLVFGAALAVSLWTIITTIAPKADYIASLFSSRPVSGFGALPPVSPRRDRVIARVRSVQPGPYWRAAA